LKKLWQEDIPEVDCVIDDNFCQVTIPCDEAKKKLKPVSIQMGGQVFEMAPSLYLH
jgi:hypothetical protein